jgi:hypothetical protein
MLDSLTPMTFSPVTFAASKRKRRGKPNYMADSLAKAEAAWREPRFADMPQFPLPEYAQPLPLDSPLRRLGANVFNGAMTTWLGRNNNVLRPLVTRIFQEFPNGARIRNHGAGEKSPLNLTLLLLRQAAENDPQARDAKERKDLAALTQRERELMLDLQRRYPRTHVDLNPNTISVLNAGQCRISDPRDMMTLKADQGLTSCLVRHAVLPNDAQMTIFQLRPTLRHALGRVKEGNVVDDAKTMPPVDIMLAENVAPYVRTQGDPLQGDRIANDYLRSILRKVTPNGYAVFGMADVVDPPVAGQTLTFTNTTRRIIADEGFEPDPSLPHAQTLSPPGTPPMQTFSGPVVFRRVKRS